MPYISVIIPVYNAEKYIIQCVESMKKQTYEDFEVILVDDGSIDNSLAICKEYEKKDNRFKAITKKNGGPNSARKEGTLIAKGKYIAYIDIDDWVEPDYLQKFVDETKSCAADIVVAGGVVDNGRENINVQSSINFGTYLGSEQLSYIISNMMIVNYKWGILPALWSKCIKADLARETISKIDERIYYGEDTAVWVTCMLKAQAVSIIDYSGYHYIEHGSSISRSKSPKIFENIMLLHEYLEKEFEESRYKEFVGKQLETYTINLMKYAANSLWGYTNDFEMRNLLQQKEVDLSEWKNRLWVLDRKVLTNYKRVLVFGAGAVGYSYVYQLKNFEEPYEVVGWTDNNCSIKEVNGYTILPLEQALKLEYDVILISVLKEYAAGDIRWQLITKGVDANKIIWTKPWKLNECLHKL